MINLFTSMKQMRSRVLTAPINNRNSKERNAPNLLSRQLSVMNIIGERQSTMLRQHEQLQLQKSQALAKDFQIKKLKINFQTVMNTAISERLQNSKAKEQIMGHSHRQSYLQKKLKQLENELQFQRGKMNILLRKQEESSKINGDLSDKCKELESILQKKDSEIQKLKVQVGKIQSYKILLKDLDPLKSRIISLEEQVRGQKLIRKQAEERLKQREKEREELLKQISNTKPREQQLRQRIAYFERVNLDLTRKMEDYNRRQNDYIKQITGLKINLNKMTAERDQINAVCDKKSSELQQKTARCHELQQFLLKKQEAIEILKQELNLQQSTSLMLKQNLMEKQLFYKSQGEQNKHLKQRCKLIQEHQLDLRRTIEGYVKIADEVNLKIVAKIEQIRKLKAIIDAYKTQLNQCQQKYEKFDKLVQEGSQKSKNQIKEGFYSYVRLNDQLIIQMKQIKASMNEKVIINGQERDVIERDRQMRSALPPTDQNQYLAIFYQKTEALILLQKSNDQLLKIKKDLEAYIEKLLQDIQKQKRDMIALKLKTAEMLRAKKELEEAKKTMLRYQEMIEQQKETITDLQSQLGALRQRNAQLNEKNFLIDLQRRNLQVKIKQYNEIMKELNLQVLERNKKINDKNSHLINDSLLKMDSAIKSLQFYFNCAFCGELPTTPVTLAMCGHTYCLKCKEAYTESCYECDTGQPIEKVFQNKFLKDASGKYKFLKMVVSELKSNFVKN